MDQNGLFKTEISSNNPNKYHHNLIRRTLQFLVPVSLASFLLSYTSSSFSFLFTYNFQYFPSLPFPLFSHAFERKYMFLICNGILAFLVKTLSFNDDNSSISVLDINDNDELYTKVTDEFIGEPASAESSPDQNVALADDEEEEKHGTTTQIKAAVAGEEEQEYLQAGPEEDALAIVELGEKTNVSSAAENEGGQTGDFIIQSKELEMMSEVEDEEEEEEEEEEDTERGGGALAQQVNVNMNTEELNKKFEEFIRKMKEEIRIHAQQQLIAV